MPNNKREESGAKETFNIKDATATIRYLKLRTENAVLVLEALTEMKNSTTFDSLEKAISKENYLKKLNEVHEEFKTIDREVKKITEEHKSLLNPHIIQKMNNQISEAIKATDDLKQHGYKPLGKAEKPIQAIKDTLKAIKDFIKEVDKKCLNLQKHFHASNETNKSPTDTPNNAKKDKGKSL